MIMKLTVSMALVGLAGAALAQNSTFATSTTTAAYASTNIVSVLTAVCDAAKVLTQNGNYYTCSEAMTLTITDCPCTSHVPPHATAPTPASTLAGPGSSSSTATIYANWCANLLSATAQALNPSAVQGQQSADSPSCPAAGAGATGAGGAGTETGTAAAAGPPSTTPMPSHSAYLYTNAAAAPLATGSDGSLRGRVLTLLALGALYALLM